MADPKALDDVLAYLDAVGFDHLYLRGESIGEEEAPRTRSTAPEPAAARPRPTRPAAPPRVAEPPRREPPAARASESTGPEDAGPGDAGPESLEGETTGPVVLDVPDGVPEDPAERFHRLEAVRRQAEACTACRLASGRRHVVFADGDPGADLMVVGEAPGAEEDRQGLPFVGPAGRLLDKILAAIDEDRKKVYICNTVKCRPPRNRDPKPDEVATCRPYLERQIDLVAPKVILAVGRVGAQALLGTGEPLGRMRGQWYEVRGVPVRVTYHPAALLRNESLKRPTWDDMKVVRDRLAELRG